ncbi:MAG: hypothetical protein QJR03_07665 [Sphaerobacter sp.]|nr:hypothetical protein [Sphaerobacter sp.]
MGYCPRCGENSAYGVPEPAARRPRSAALRIPADSRIVNLPPGIPDGEFVTYGGSRFRIRREGDDYLLEIAG